jgi:D-sedoheptulose 7-phosphate isomerase
MTVRTPQPDDPQLFDFVRLEFEQTLETLRAVAAAPEMHGTLIAAAEATAESMRRSGKLLAAGNGGSAADAQHLVAEFVVRLTVDRPPMRAVALTTDSSILTAASNDYGYAHVFERQVEALGLPGDIFLGISTSGRSKNVLLALRKAKEMDLKTIGLCGNHAETMAPWCDFLLAVPSSVTQHIQECHLALEHVYCALVERCYFGIDFPLAATPPAATVRV